MTDTRKTAEQIALEADHLPGRANTIAINRAFRAQDESHLWPVRGRFNATERAIKRVRAHYAQIGEPCEGLQYALTLDDEITRVVNESV